MITNDDIVTEYGMTEMDTTYTWKRRCIIYMALINAGKKEMSSTEFYFVFAKKNFRCAGCPRWPGCVARSTHHKRRNEHRSEHQPNGDVANGSSGKSLCESIRFQGSKELATVLGFDKRPVMALAHSLTVEP